MVELSGQQIRVAVGRKDQERVKEDFENAGGWCVVRTCRPALADEVYLLVSEPVVQGIGAQDQRRRHGGSVTSVLRQCPSHVVDDFVEVIILETGAHEEQMVGNVGRLDHGKQCFAVRVVAEVVVAGQDNSFGPRYRAMQLEKPFFPVDGAVRNSCSLVVDIRRGQFEESVVVQRDRLFGTQTREQRRREAVLGGVDVSGDFFIEATGRFAVTRGAVDGCSVQLRRDAFMT